ncbi:30S ribosomal protein S12 methylthiotransferase RimO [Anaerorhabdus sp.]|uniref:30S ribosomal protein S12 methylthiotransferase RimO n=1 Tax=Anaerorhabdus sp. TaxID=1872524 RepID=UPI002FCA6175
MKIGIISLGCCKNLVDTENLIGMLQQSNQEITYNLNEAEAIIVNTCGFIDPAKEEGINTILEMAEYKEKKCKKLIVMGCLSERYYDQLVEELPEVDCFITLKQYNQLGPILTEVLGEKIANDYGKCPQVLTGKPWMAYLKIADGCDNRCSYCAIPLIRGGYRSFDIEVLVEQAKELAKRGVKELNLIAQDTTRYGLDNYGERRLLELLKRCNEIEGLHWIRVLYMYPDEIDYELIEGMAKLEKVLPYFDIPVQHGSNRMLSIMNRRGTSESIIDLVNKIRETYPLPALRTTMIVGFPTETLEDVDMNLEFMKTIKWDRLGGFTYSKEEDTPSYEMVDDVTQEEKERRYELMMKLQEEIVEAKNQELIGKTLEVLVEKQDGLTGFYRGRSVFSAPDGIDGEVIFKSETPIEFGTFVPVTINRIKAHDFYGNCMK